MRRGFSNLKRRTDFPAREQRSTVSFFLKEHQNTEAVRRMDLLLASFFKIYLGISFLIVLYYRVSDPLLLNMLLANLALPNLLVLVVLPVLHTLSRYWDRIDGRVAVAKILVLYFGNIAAILISVLPFTLADNFMSLVQASFGARLADLVSLFLFFLLALIWVRAVYLLCESIELRWLESVYQSSTRIARLVPNRDEHEPSEAKVFIAIGSAFSKLGYLIVFFTILNLAFIISTLSERYFTEFSDVVSLLPLEWLTIILLILLTRSIFLTIIDGHKKQIQILEGHSGRED